MIKIGDRLRKGELVQEYDVPENNLYSWSLDVTDRVQEIFGGGIVEEARWNCLPYHTEKEAVDSVDILLNKMDKRIKEKKSISLRGPLFINFSNGRVIKFECSEWGYATLIEE